MELLIVTWLFAGVVGMETTMVEQGQPCQTLGRIQKHEIKSLKPRAKVRIECVPVPRYCPGDPDCTQGK